MSYPLHLPYLTSSHLRSTSPPRASNVRESVVILVEMMMRYDCILRLYLRNARRRTFWVFELPILVNSCSSESIFVDLMLQWWGEGSGVELCQVIESLDGREG